MWLLRVLGKVFSVQISSESEWEEIDLAPSYVVDSLDDESLEDEMKAYIEESVDAWTQLFVEENDFHPTDEQVDAQKLIVEYAFREVAEIKDAITYMVDAMYDGEEEEIPESVYKVAQIAVIEYITGILKIVQTQLDAEAESEN